MSLALFFPLYQHTSYLFQGKMIGVTIGCLLGMFPLLFFNNNEKEDLSTPEASVQEDTNPRI